MPGTVSLQGARYIGQRLGLLAFFAVLLFLASGTVDWLRGWVTIATMFIAEACTLCLLAFFSSNTLNQRGSSHADVKRFDMVFAILWLFSGIVTAVVAGFDAVRFGWSVLPWSWFYVGVAVLTCATAFGTWAMLENEHFEQFVRVQHDRRHRVVTTGPYRFVRHPGYVAAIGGGLSVPLMFGSIWTFVPVLLVASLFVVRTKLEDETLLEELTGYGEYAARVRFRLVPFVW